MPQPRKKPAPAPRAKVGKLTVIDRLAARKVKVSGPAHIDQANIKEAYFGGEAPDPRALRDYLEWAHKEYSAVPMLGLDVRAADASGKAPMTLDQIYVGLDTTATVKPPRDDRRRRSVAIGGGEAGSRPLAALEAIVQHRHVALLGLPGAGKSTFLRHLGHCLTGHLLEPRKEWLRRLAVEVDGESRAVWPANEAGVAPLTIELRKFAASFGGTLPGRAEPHHLWDYFSASLQAPYDRARAALQEAALDGRAIFFLDGMDEVSKSNQEKLKLFVRDAVAALAASPFGKSRMILTCRTFSYRGQGWQVPGFPDFELRDFDTPKIQGFIRRWYEIQAERGQIKSTQVKDRCRSLWNGLQERDLRPLAGNPVQLTSIAIVDCHHSRLPESRAKLYDELIKLLLYRWDDLRFDDQSGPARLSVLLREAGSNEECLLRVLRELAWQAQEGQPGGGPAVSGAASAGGISESSLLSALRTLHSDAGNAASWAEEVLRTIESRSGLLQSPQAENRVFSFPHRSYQEFLAGAWLTDRCENEFVQTAAGLVDESRYWWEVVRWAVGIQARVRQNFHAPLGLVAELAEPPEAAPVPRLAWLRLLLAGHLLAEMEAVNLRGLAAGKTALAKVSSLLVRLIQSESLPPVERAEAGIVLAKLGDPRPGVGLDDQTKLPLFDWVDVPASKFKGGDGLAPRTLSAFRLSRYPTTVAQYRAFVAKGYAEDGTPEREAELKRWWGDEGLKWKRASKIDGPEIYDDPVFQTPNHPQVGVSWYEAAAFCRWVSESLGGEENIRLPDEAEWEQAARWAPEKGNADDRYFAWAGSSKGDKDLGQRCNCSATELGHTSAVGLFPSSQAGCGALDMTGNVWEWSENKVGNSSRGLRGGSWVNVNPASLSVSFRINYVPVFRSNLVGFRVVCDGSSARG